MGIVERLRGWQAAEAPPQGRTAPDAVSDMHEAADRIEALEARVAGLTHERDFHRETADLHADRIAALKAENAALEAKLADVSKALMATAEAAASSAKKGMEAEAKLAVAREALDRVFMEDRRIVDHWRQSMATGDSHLDTKIVLGRYAEIARAALKEIGDD